MEVFSAMHADSDGVVNDISNYKFLPSVFDTYVEHDLFCLLLYIL